MAKSEAIKRLKNAWDLLCDRIDQVHEEFLEEANEEKLADKHFVCWEEADVPFQLEDSFISIRIMENMNFIFK